MRIVDTIETEMVVEDWTMTSEAAVDEPAAAVAVRFETVIEIEVLGIVSR